MARDVSGNHRHGGKMAATREAAGGLLLLGLLLLLLLQGTTCNAQEESCDAAADVCLVLDESGSISNAEFQLVLDFAVRVLENITISSNSTRVCLITYSTSTRIKFHLNTYNDSAGVMAAVRALINAGGATNTELALDLMDTTMFTAANGDRPDVPNIGILVTDGYSSRPSLTITEAQEARSNGAFIFAIGVSGARQSELQAIASDPDELYVFNIADFNYLSDVAAKLLPKACAIAETGGQIVGRGCTNSSDCESVIAGTACDLSSLTCQCSPSSTVYDVILLACRSRQYGDACAADADCATMNGTCVESAGTCGCGAWNAPYEGVCYECLLGGACPGNIQCDTVHPYSACVDGVLTCRGGFLAVNASDAYAGCRPMVLEEDACAVTDDCTSGAECTDDKVCACTSMYKADANKTSCLPRQLDDACAEDTACGNVEGAVCLVNQCACGRAYIRLDSSCRGRQVGENCVVNEDCGALPGGGLCGSTNLTCECRGGYITLASTSSCRARGLGEACSELEVCGLSHSHCVQAACACVPGALQDNSTCYLVAAASQGQADLGAILGGVFGSLAVLAVCAGVGAAIKSMAANAAYRAKAVDAMRMQTEMTSQCVEKMFPCMTPGTCNVRCSPPPCSTSFCRRG